MNPRYDIQLMVKVAQLYYDKGLKQELIAKELGISRSSISMILTEAKLFGIVEINVKNPLENNEKLSSDLESRFNIDKCIIVPTTITDSKLLTKIVAERAVTYVDEIMKADSTIGIAWGTTCFEFMSSFASEEDYSGSKVVPLIGGTNMVESEFQLNEMVRRFAKKINGIPSFIHALAIPETLNDKMLYMQSSDMQEIVAKWQKLDIAVISAGAPPEFYAGETPSSDITYYENDLNQPVGDICARWINIEGAFIDCAYNEKVVGVSVEDLKKAKKVVCIAAGPHKVLSLVGAVKSGVIDVFITDEQTAKSLLKHLD